jgi:glucosylglycerol 3-phosphatase
MKLAAQRLSRDHEALLATLLARGSTAADSLLIIQDLDGVCMQLVRDPRTRRIERRYIEASRALAGHFFVLTNGEHAGTRGVNSLIEAAFDDPARARAEGLYLPGAAGGGVQLQDAQSKVSHPGVTTAELAFLAGVPARTRAMLDACLREPPFGLGAREASELAAASVLDNAVSPTVNLNRLHAHAAVDAAGYRALQAATAGFLDAELARAASEGLAGAFFVHLAPNLGQAADGRERLKAPAGDDAGTTDFQFMLRGAVKEAAVLVLLNHYWFRHFGVHPLGPDFSARAAPADQSALLELAATHFEPERMPRIVGVGDTVTARAAGTEMLRGGSDRGFLTLVQELGRHFGSDNATLFVDSSGGEVRRPGLGSAAAGITDREDPLTLNFVFPGGHEQYVDFFCRLAARWQAPARQC